MNGMKLSPNEIKLQNRQTVYDYIRKNDVVSKQDLVVALQLSLPTVTQNLEYLKKQGLIDTSKKIKNTGGRNATGYSCVEDAKLAIGISLTGHHMNAVVVDLSGNIVALIKEREIFSLDSDEYLHKIYDVVERIKNQVGITEEQLLGVGISVPGLVSEDGETVIYGKTLNFTGKTREEIAKYIPYDNRLFHDSFVASYAEVWIDQSISNAFYINLGNSVGGAFIVDREVYAGNNHRSGEIGHMMMKTNNGKKCYCGQSGCFETMCRATILDKETDGNLERFFNQLKDGDKKLEQIWDEYLDDLAIGIHNICMLFDGIVIIGGHVGAYIGDYMEILYDKIDRLDPFGNKAKDYLYQCQYKIEAAAAGAALYYIDDFIKGISDEK